MHLSQKEFVKGNFLVGLISEFAEASSSQNGSQKIKYFHHASPLRISSLLQQPRYLVAAKLFLESYYVLPTYHSISHKNHGFLHLAA